MKDFAPAYVLDASVGIKLFLVEPLSEVVDELFSRLDDDPPLQLYVPDLFFIECANILWKRVQRFHYPLLDAQQHVENLATLDLRTASTRELAEDALVLAATFTISAYDACYVALADGLNVPLLTADEALVRRMQSTSYSVQWLGELGME